MRAALASLWLLSGADAAKAPAPAPADQLVVSAQAQDLSPGGGGASASVDWIHPASSGTVLVAGVMASELAGSRWAYGKLGASHRTTRVLTLAGEIDLGPGEQDQERFTFQAYKAAATVELRRGKLYGELEDQYVNIGAANGNILKLGLLAFPRPSLVTGASFYVSTSGNLEARYVTARAEGSWGSATLLGGFALGETRPEILGVLTAAPSQRSRELYAGVKVRRGARELTVILDLLRLEGVRKGSLTVAWKTPL